MAAVDDPKTLGRTRLSFASEADVDEFAATLARFEAGEIGADQWRAFRLVRGTYGQRQAEDAQMLRCKIPQGVLDGKQLDALADVAERYSRGFGHITTRQNLQFHFVKLHDVEPAMRLLADAGMTTREACGNSVRNITCCPYAGVASDEPFDVTPYAEAMTRYLLRHPLSSSLPRKFKVSFEGCGEDHSYAAVNDLGFRARVENGRRGFRVTCGGGTAILCRDGGLLHAFIPTEELFLVAEAAVRVFHAKGDREHRQRNRLKFLIRELGWDGFLAAYREARAQAASEGVARVPPELDATPEERAPSGERPAAPSEGEVAARAAKSIVKGHGTLPEVTPQLSTSVLQLAQWKKSNVLPQKQRGHSVVTATLVLGDVTSAQLRLLGELARCYGDGLVRVTHEQNALLRWVKDEDVDALYRRLAAAGLGLPGATTVADVTSCPGAESCRLAVTQSRGLGTLLGDVLREKPELAALGPDVKIKISGCPNGCGLHHVAGIGFQGSIRKVGAKVVPQYFVMLGGGIDEKGASFGRIAAKVPARRVPEALQRLLQAYARDKRAGESGLSFFRRLELPAVKALLGDLEEMTPDRAKPEDFIDLAETTEFKPETMEGECAA
jgi:sulfite reductase beta subunit-like hemoprotein